MEKIKEEAKQFIDLLVQRKIFDLSLIDLSGENFLFDYIIICSTKSLKQSSATAEFVEVELKKKKIKALSIEGKQDGNWVLLDYGNVIIHIFYEETRKLYQIERIWENVKILENLEK